MVKKTLSISLLALAVVLAVLVFSACGKGGLFGSKNAIGVVLDEKGRGDKGFNDSAYYGLEIIARSFSGYIKGSTPKVNFGKEVEIVCLTPKDPEEKVTLLSKLAKEGYTPVYGIGASFAEPVKTVAKDFPKTQFILIDAVIPNLNTNGNIACIIYREHEGAFLVGAMAGLLNKDGKVGFVGAIDSPFAKKMQAAFMAGALYANKNLRSGGMILSQYLGKNANADSAYKAAGAMYKKGVSIIFNMAGPAGAGVFKAATEMNKQAIGADVDEALVYPDYSKAIITSMLKKISQAIFVSASEAMRNGKIAGGITSYGLVDEAMGYVYDDANKTLIEPIKEQLEDNIKLKLVNEMISIPGTEAQIPEWVKGLGE
jgi:basic membrane protein A